MTQPEIYIGFTPTLNAGHGNHQQAAALISFETPGDEVQALDIGLAGL
jgi:hypothetical protein